MIWFIHLLNQHPNGIHKVIYNYMNRNSLLNIDLPDQNNSLFINVFDFFYQHTYSHTYKPAEKTKVIDRGTLG